MPPAAIAVMRISGPQAGEALHSLAGPLPPPRVASLRQLRDGVGEPLDQALILWFPGPATATGEDLAELHLHGGRAVVAAVKTALARIPGLREAQAGEFTRRAFANGRIDLAEAEGLADLLSAETELQRRHALALASGALSQRVHQWRDTVLHLSALVEATLDFADEDDVSGLPPSFMAQVQALLTELQGILETPRAEVLREGFRVVLAGPPNSGKSSLFNALIGVEAAIATPIAGTTRDVLSRPVALAGIPFLFADTAGLRDDASDPVEAIGIQRARSESDSADLVLWLGRPGEGAGRCIWNIASFADVTRDEDMSGIRHHVSAITSEGLPALRADLIALARTAMPVPGNLAISKRHDELISSACDTLQGIFAVRDPLLVAEHLRLARDAFDRLLGRTGTEEMLDALFGRFCIGK